jgi:hypothetical protein
MKMAVVERITALKKATVYPRVRWVLLMSVLDMP